MVENGTYGLSLAQFRSKFLLEIGIFCNDTEKPSKGRGRRFLATMNDRTEIIIQIMTQRSVERIGTHLIFASTTLSGILSASSASQLA
jgi:hypothetical protein